MTTKAITPEMSHDRVRLIERRPSDGGSAPMPPAENAEPFQDPKTGRIVNGRAAARRRKKIRDVKGVQTLNPARCESWLAPHVKAGATHGVELLGRFPDPALAALVGATADAHSVFRGLISQGGQGDAKALSEAKAWLREYRACLRELVVLSDVAKAAAESEKDPHAALARFTAKDES